MKKSLSDKQKSILDFMRLSHENRRVDLGELGSRDCDLYFDVTFHDEDSFDVRLVHVFCNIFQVPDGEIDLAQAFAPRERAELEARHEDYLFETRHERQAERDEHAWESANDR